MSTIRREVEDRRVRMNPGHEKHWAVGGTVTLVLKECGHEVIRRLSQQPKPGAKVRCLDCERLRDGATRLTKHGDGPWIRTTWDKENEIPVRSTISEEEANQLRTP